ncbi:MAG TPA: hypothetical protein VGK43_03535 [Solirubrobacterales bacterium]
MFFAEEQRNSTVLALIAAQRCGFLASPELQTALKAHGERMIAAERARIRAALLAEFAEAGWIERHATDMRAIIDRIAPEEG